MTKPENGSLVVLVSDFIRISGFDIRIFSRILSPRMDINWIIAGVLAAACVIMMLLERWGLPVVLTLGIKGDLKRESRWFAQYGQFACSLVGAAIVARLDERGWKVAGPLVIAPLTIGLLGGGIKRVLGRVRPGHPGAGHFMGFSARHANWRESFPSNHSATAVSFSVGLAYLYPPIAIIVWPLALITASIRYLMDAHWPSDVLGGVAFGYVMTPIIWDALRHFQYFA